MWNGVHFYLTFSPQMVCYSLGIGTLDSSEPTLILVIMEGQFFGLNMVLFLLLLQLLLMPSSVCKIYGDTSHMIIKAFEHEHEYYASGHHIVGGILSHIIYIFEREDFKQFPKPKYKHLVS